MFTLGNGIERRNSASQLVLTQITPHDFDPDETLRYTVQYDGTFAFESRADYEAALANLRATGYHV